MGSRTVLVVEDSSDEAQILEEGLRGSIPRCSMVFCATTTDAEKYLFADPRATKALPDLIVLGVSMPPLGGLELLQKIRSNVRTKRIPVLVMSETMPEEHIRAIYRNGANSYLVK